MFPALNSLDLKVHAGDTAIAQISARLVGDPFGETRITEQGSTVRIAKNLYVSAGHIVRGYADDYGQVGECIQASLWAIHVCPGPIYEIWEVDAAWVHPNSDLAVLHTKPWNDVASNRTSVACAQLALAPPPVGHEVIAFGYAYRATTPRVTVGADATKHIEANANPATSIGQVVQIFENGRGDKNLSFPCFQFNSRIDGGMSGGPIFDRQGKVCGIALYSLEEEKGVQPDFVSYGAILAPLMGLMITIGADGKRVSNPYPIVELAQKGMILVDGWGKWLFLHPR